VVLPATHTTDLKKVSEVVGEKKLSFANPETLREKLGVEVGSVSPFSLLNDTLHEVEVYIDQVVYDADIVSFHPNRNTASLELSGAMFRKFLELMKQKIEVVNL
jgi:Ala-tRNA(Pro) deacylase